MPQSSASINTAEMLICKGILFCFFNLIIKKFLTCTHAITPPPPHPRLQHTQARRHTQWCSMACFSLSAWLHSSVMSLLWQTVFGLQWQSSQNETSHIKAKVSQVGMWQYERKWKTINTVCMRLYVCILDVYIDCTVKLSTSIWTKLDLLLGSDILSLLEPEDVLTNTCSLDQ